MAEASGKRLTRGRWPSRVIAARGDYNPSRMTQHWHWRSSGPDGQRRCGKGQATWSVIARLIQNLQTDSTAERLRSTTASGLITLAAPVDALSAGTGGPRGVGLYKAGVADRGQGLGNRRRPG